MFLRLLQHLASGLASYKAPQKSAVLLDVGSVQFKPTAILIVRSAPEVSLQSNKGIVLRTVNIEEVSFSSVLQEWADNYSLVYPSEDEWQSFWQKCKGTL